MEYEIQKGETVYVLKLNRQELGYLAHIIKRDECTCGQWDCSNSHSALDIMIIADAEGIKY